MPKMRKTIELWLPVIIWALVIFLFSSYPTGRATEVDYQDFIIKKTAHILEYGFFTILLFRGFRGSGVSMKKAILLSVFVAIFYGMTDEFHQSFTPGREPTFRDIIFDTIGSILAIFGIWKLLPKAPRRLRELAQSLQIN